MQKFRFISESGMAGMLAGLIVFISDVLNIPGDVIPASPGQAGMTEK